MRDANRHAPGCCSPSRETASQAAPSTPATAAADPADVGGMISLPGGSFVMGSMDQLAYPGDGEAPHEVEVSPFMIDRCAVSNAQFSEFVTATGYVTEAERYGWSFVFAGMLPEDFPPTRGVAAAPWWRQVQKADWKRPASLDPALPDLADHPVVHVSFNDALSYCQWAGKRLPTEAEWEFAGRGGLARAAFPWGDELTPGGEHRMNVWQGSFPTNNTLRDGYYGTCPVDAYPPNGYGLYNVTGNVWEWTADWFAVGYREHDRRVDPTGPPTGTHRVSKGGSHLCHVSYCRRYRVAARQGNEPDSSTSNLGFRCAADANVHRP